MSTSTEHSESSEMPKFDGWSVHDETGMCEVHATKLLTPAEVAEYLSVSRSRVYELLAAGDLPSVKLGKYRRVPLGAVAAFVRRLLPSGPVEIGAESP